MSNNHQAAAELPTSFGYQLRACRGCRLVKTRDQFRQSGCENCNLDETYEDANFTGIISVIDPTKSWAAKWLRINARYVPGCYALALSEEEEEELQPIMKFCRC